MKATNEKKGIFSFYSHNVDKKISVVAISIIVDLMFRLIVQIINKNEDTHHKHQQLHTLHCKLLHWI